MILTIVFSTVPVRKSPCAHEINLRDNEQATSRTYRLAYNQRAEVDKQIDRLFVREGMY